SSAVATPPDPGARPPSTRPSLPRLPDDDVIPRRSTLMKTTRAARLKHVGAAGAVALLLALGACSSAADDGSAPGGGDGGTPYVALVSKGFQHQFRQAVKTGADGAADDLGIEGTVEGP